jgi:glyoxylate reductase
MKKVFVSYPIPDEPLNILREKYEVVINEKKAPLNKEELIAKCKDVDAVLCMYYDVFDKEVMDQCNKLKVIANYAVGYNNIDYEYAKEKGIFVTNTPGVLTDATADLAMALLLAVARRIPEGDVVSKNGEFGSWTPTWFLGLDLSNKTIGIIGMGRIGQNFAKKAKAFNMKIIYNSRTPKKDFEKETNAVWVTKEELLKESDFISIHVSLTEETKHMISTKELNIMKKNAVLINTSRGPVVDEDALADALIENKIYGAGLDVYENEPSINKKLIGLDNVVLTPHIGSSTFETRIRMSEIAANNIFQVLQGEKPSENVY